jgi:hypothetical protein
MEITGRLEGVQAYAIHGSPYYRVFYSLPDDPDTIHQCQLPAEAFDATLRPGDAIAITMLLKTVMAIGHAEPS